MPPIPSPAPSPYIANETGKSGGGNITQVPGKAYDGLLLEHYTNDWDNWCCIDWVGASFATDGSGKLPTFEMQVLVNGQWKAYQQWKSALQSPDPTVQCTGLYGQTWLNNTFEDPEFVSLDPRTVRFGVWGNEAKNAAPSPSPSPLNYYDYRNGAEDTMDEWSNGTGVMEKVTKLPPQPSTSFPSSSGKNYYLYSSNATANEQYGDLDSVKRRGDWTTDPNGNTNTKTIMYPANSADRPQILSAQSVAELGQVFRDQPWKTLNFTTADSGDVGLLDAFTLQDVSMTAGKTSLNTRQTPVLTAILSKAALRLDGSSVLTSPQVTDLVTDIASVTAANPLINKSQLIAQLATKTSLIGLANKEARECVVRALSDAGQTRTWNLMIDIIAQSGRYPSSAANLSQFMVEGEKRYWLHVAIDRFTGQIIDQQLEEVFE